MDPLSLGVGALAGIASTLGVMVAAGLWVMVAATRAEAKQAVAESLRKVERLTVLGPFETQAVAVALAEEGVEPNVRRRVLKRCGWEVVES